MAISNKNVGYNIANLRAGMDMTQQQLAAALGVSHQAVSKWETGTALPDLETLLNLSRLFNVTVEDLLKDAPKVEEEESQEKASVDAAKVWEGIKGVAGQTFQNAKESAGQTFQKAQAVAGQTLQNAKGFSNSLFKKVSSFFDNKPAKENTQTDTSLQETVEPEEPKADEEDIVVNTPVSETVSGLDLDTILQLAPFMSREKVGELLLEYEGEIPVSTLLRLAPFTAKDALAEKVASLNKDEINSDTIVKLAPYLSKETLNKLIMQNPNKLDINALKRLAPFLSKNTVDTLVNVVRGVRSELSPNNEEGFMGKARKSIEGFIGKIKENLEAQNAEKQSESADEESDDAQSADTLKSVQENIGNIVDKTRKGMEGIFSKIKEGIASLDPNKQEEDSVNDECAEEDGTAKSQVFEEATEPKEEENEKDILCRSALEARSWNWIRLNLSEIKSESLKIDIVTTALDELDTNDANDIMLNTVPYMSAATFKALLGKLCSRGNWESVCELESLTDETNAGDILVLAAEGGSAALDTIKLYAPKASRSVWNEVSKDAINAGKWDLVNALTANIK